MMGRKLRTTILVIPEMLDPEWMDRDDVFLRDQRYKERYKCGYDQHYNTQPLPELKPGDSVRIKTDKDKLWILNELYRKQIQKGDRTLLKHPEERTAGTADISRKPTDLYTPITANW